MSLSDYAYAPPPEEERRESAKPHMPPLSQVDRNLIRENAKLQEVNSYLHAENQDLQDRIRSVKRIAWCLAAVIAVMLFVSVNMYQSLQQANSQLDSALANNDTLADQVDSLQAQVNTLTATPTAVASNTVPKMTTKPQTSGQTMVYVTPYGKRYHDSARCAGYDPDCIPLSEAKSKGYTPCKTCKPSN